VFTCYPFSRPSTFSTIDVSDAGFDPIDHGTVDLRLETWDDVRALGDRTEIMADVIVDDVSNRSPQYLDFREQGEDSANSGMFLIHGRVFPNGARESDLVQIYRPGPGLPFAKALPAKL
jgi:sucrose phosphorylase